MWERGAMRPLAAHMVLEHTVARGLEQYPLSVAERPRNKLAQRFRVSPAVGQPPSKLRREARVGREEVWELEVATEEMLVFSRRSSK